MKEPSEASMARVRAGRNPLYSTVREAQLGLVPLPPDSGQCIAETFDGLEIRRCTRPAAFLRDGMACCHQHARLDRVRPAE